MSVEPPSGSGQPPRGEPPTGGGGPPVDGGSPWYTQPLFIVGGIAAVIIVIVIIVVVALAGGNGDDGEEATVQASPSPAIEETEDVAAGEGEEEEEVGDGDGDGDDDVFGDLESLAAGAESAFEGEPIKVIYDITQPDFTGQWTLSQDPPKSLVEIRGTDQAGQEFFTSVITTTADGVTRIEPQPGQGIGFPLLGQVVTYVCSGFGSEGSCFVSDATQAEAQTAPVSFLYLLPQQIVESALPEFVSTSSDTIAGQSVTCYTVDEPDDAGQGEVCFSDNSSLVLRMRFEDSLFEATFVGPPSDEDFQCCPFEIFDLGEIPTQP